MSLRDHPPSPISKIGRPRRVDEILAELPEEDAEALRSWLADLRYSPEKIRDELAVEKIHVGVATIARYRYEVLGLGERKR